MRHKNQAKRIALLGVLLAAASITFLIESLVPPLLPIAPYVKIGLANCFVLYVIACFGLWEAFFFVVAKNLLTALFAGWYVFPFNLAGSLSSFLVMACLYSWVFPKISMTAISIAGAILNNIARTAVAVWWMEAPSLWAQLPFVCAFGVATGTIIGILTTICIKQLPERLTNFL